MECGRHGDVASVLGHERRRARRLHRVPRVVRESSFIVCTPLTACPDTRYLLFPGMGVLLAERRGHGHARVVCGPGGRARPDQGEHRDVPRQQHLARAAAANRRLAEHDVHGHREEQALQGLSSALSPACCLATFIFAAGSPIWTR